MHCAFCQQPAERACTRCGRFFCPAHGGERRVLEADQGVQHPVTRVVCDSCTPDEGTIREVERFNRSVVRFLIGFAIVGFVVAMIAIVALIR
jgi:hypothetical protein